MRSNKLANGAQEPYVSHEPFVFHSFENVRKVDAPSSTAFEAEWGEDVKLSGKARALKFLVGLLCVFVAVEAILYLIVLPSFRSVQIVYEGMARYTARDFAAIIGRNSTNTWAHFDTAAAASALASFDGVESVYIEKHFPDRVLIRVTERDPVAITFTTFEGRTAPVMLDKNGVVFPVRSVSAESHLPLLTGLPVENHGSGMRLPKMYRPLLEELADSREGKQRYFAALSEIRVVEKNYGSFELILYPIHSHVRVLMDRGLNEEALQYMMVVLDVVNSIDPDAREIDLRYGSVSYRKTVSDFANAVTEGVLE
jgi:cell division protein FtsQ